MRLKSNSWYVIDRQTGRPVCELFEPSNVLLINRAKYKVRSTHRHLCDLNKIIARRHANKLYDNDELFLDYRDYLNHNK